MTVINKDVVILGAGPAGLTCGLYCARYNLDTLIIEKNKVGGKLNVIKHLDNYPGFNNTDGTILANDMLSQVEKFNVEIINKDIDSVDIMGGITLTSGEDIIKAKALVLACGANNSKASIKGEKEFIGKGVSYCATCDAMFYKGKDVAVCGNNAISVQEALHLSHIVNKVYYICDKLIDLPETKLLQDSSNVEIISDGKVVNINGDDHLSSIDIQGKEDINLPVSALFPYDNVDGSLHFLKVFNLQDNNGFIKVDSKQSVGLPGIYAAGDICVKSLRQVVTAASDGAIAALSIFEYVRGINR